jgi:hypothetical protein
MKGIIEASIYLIIMTLICVISVEFIILNRQVSKVNEVSGYIRDYIEVHGTQTDNQKLDAHTENVLTEYAKENHMSFTYNYEDHTSKYEYYNIQVGYTLEFPLFHIKKEHSCKRLAKTSVDTVPPIKMQVVD